MKKQVLAYTKPASEILKGDMILVERMVVATVESVEHFENPNKRGCVAVAVRTGAELPSAMCFVAKDTVLVVE